MTDLFLYGGGELGERAFCYCSALKNITIGSNVKSFSYREFEELYSEGYPTIYTTFDNCNNIKIVTLLDVEAYCKIKNTFTLTEVGQTNKLLRIGEEGVTSSLNLPAGITSIESRAFYHFGLQEIKLPPTLRKIGSQAFCSTSDVQRVYSYATTPPATTGRFVENPGNATLYVPIGSKEKYQTASNWKAFKVIEEIEVEYAQLTPNYIEARVGDDPVELTMPGHEIISVSSSNPAVAEWIDGKVVTHASYYTGQGKYTTNDEATLLVTGDDGAFAYCVVKIIPQAQLTDGAEYTNPEDVEMESVVYTRNFGTTGKWQQLYIPFSMSYEDWNSQNLDVARINAYYEYDDDEDGVIDRHVLQVMKVTEANGALRPNHPYLVRAREAGSKRIEVADTKLCQADENSIECSTTETRYVFTGTYKILTGLMSAGYYYLSDGAMVTAANDDVKVKSYRWYLRRETKDGQFLVNDENAPSHIAIRVIGEEFEDTSIEVVNEDMFNETTYIYNLNGQKVSDGDMSNLPVGVYIRNDKKIYIK